MSSNTTSQRTFQDESGPYVLPNDSEEHERLDAQYKAFLKVMGKTFHTPLENPRKILDVGCGTGILSAELARKYPNAEVIGLDIAPVPVHRHGKPPNLTYIQGDIAKLAEENEGLFASETFDYVFSRLLIFAITDWPTHVKRLMGLLAPGGWIELHDYSFDIFAGPNRTAFVEGMNMTATWDWHNRFISDCKATGLDLCCGAGLNGWTEAAGAGNIREEVYRIPAGGPVEKAEEPGPQYWKEAPNALEGLIRKVCSKTRNPEEVNKMVGEMREAYRSFDEGDWSGLYVVIGQAK